MRWPPRRRLVELVSLAFLVSYVLLVGLGIEQQKLPDYAAFYAMARALARGGPATFHQLYSLSFQIRAEAFLSAGPSRSYVEPFVALPPAALPVLPFTLLPLWPSFFLWDGLCLGLCVLGTLWLVRQQRLGPVGTALALAIVASYPTYQALSEGQYDLLWPLCIALFTAAWRSPGAWARWWRVAAASLVFTFKPDLLLLLAVPAAAAWRRRPVRRAAVCVLVLAAISLALLGGAGLLRLSQLESYTLFARFPPVLDETVLGLLWNLLGPGPLARDLAWAALGLALLGLSWAWWRNPPRTEIDWCLALTSTVCLSLLVAPHSLSHDLMLLCGPAVWTATALQRAGRSLYPLAAWMLALNASVIVDNSTRIHLPFPLVPFLLLAAGLSAWRARRALAGARVRAPERAELGVRPGPLSLG